MPPIEALDRLGHFQARKPDSVVHQYDSTDLSLSDGDAVSTWPDSEGSKDLSAGTAPTYRTGQINGNPAVYFDGSDDYLENTSISVTQPDAVFIVANAGTGPGRYWTGASSERQLATNNSSSSVYGIWANSWVEGGSPDGGLHIIGGVYDGTNSELRVDGSVIQSGDAGTNDIIDFRLSATNSAGNFKEMDAGEVLILDSPSDAHIKQAESYLSDKWGISI